MLAQQSEYQTGTRYKRYTNTRNTSKPVTSRKLADCLNFVTKLTENQLKHIEISPGGEFHTCGSGKDALDMVNHIKGTLRYRGFGCYALHNHVWIVPFVHQSLHVPDFEKAKQVLPDMKGELLGKIFPDKSLDETVKPNNKNRTICKKAWLVIAGLALIVLIII